jgi:hypothetical protein
MHAILFCLLFIYARSQMIWDQAAHDSHNSYCTKMPPLQIRPWLFENNNVSMHPLNNNIVIDPYENVLYIPVATKQDYQSILLIVSMDGNIIHNITLDEPHRRISGNPLVIRNKNQTLYMIGGYPSHKNDTPGVFAIDIKSGKRVWSVFDNLTDNPMNVYNLALSDNIILFQHDGIQYKNFLATQLDNTGRVIWGRYCERDSKISVGSDKRFYVLHGPLDIKAIDINGKDVITASLPESRWITFQDRKIAINQRSGNIFITATGDLFDVHIISFSGKDGTLLWDALLDRTPYTGFTFSSDPVINLKGDTVYVLSTDEHGNGAIAHAFNTNTGALLWRLQLPIDSIGCFKILSPCNGDTFFLTLCNKVIHVIQDGKVSKTISIAYEPYYAAAIDSNNNLFTCGNLGSEAIRCESTTV